MPKNIGIQREKTVTLKKSFLEVFEKKACNISQTCKAVNINRSTYCDWRNKDAEFNNSCQEIIEGLIDFAESQLIKNINSGMETSLLFFLKCKARHRGYAQDEVKQEPQKVEIKIIDGSKK